MDRYLTRYLTGTVGLLSMRFANGINIMAVEWTYFVAKEPPHVAVVISEDTFTSEIADWAGEFSVTLCSEDQAALADFVGSVSGRDIDKTASQLVTLREPLATSTPWVAGGIAALECEIRQTVSLPGYRMLIGEVLAAHVDEAKATQPLVKYGDMYALGEPLLRTAVVAAAELRGDHPQQIHVAAAGQVGEDETPWRLTMVSSDGRAVWLGEAAPNEYGDLLAAFGLPEACAGWNLSAAQVRVERQGIDAGWARISCRSAVGERLAERPRAALRISRPDQPPDPVGGQLL